MKRKIKIICRCAITIALLIVALIGLTKLMERKASILKYKPFFDQEENFDVLFMGSSHVINSIFPMELWNDYGIVSYNFGGHANTIPTTYWVMENALDYTTPKLIVIDCHKLMENLKIKTTASYVHQALDAFPLSMTKIKTVMDLTNDPYCGEETDGEEVNYTASEFIWNYIIYHERWSTLTKNDFDITYSREKGAESRIAVAEPYEMAVIADGAKFEGDSTGIEYLRKMIEKCQSRGIDVLLTYVPFPADEGALLSANRVYDIAEEYGVHYINFFDLDIVNFETDCYDKNSHLNPSGARKVTDYLGQYIMEHYDIPDQRNNEAYSSWKNDYVRYTNLKLLNIKGQKALDVYLMLLADKNYNAIIEINNKDIWDDKHYVDMFENLGIDMGQITEYTDFIVIQEAGKNITYLENVHETEGVQQTVLGKMQLIHSAADGEGYSMLLDDVQMPAAAVTNETLDVRIIMLDKNTMKVVDDAYFELGKDRIK